MIFIDNPELNPFFNIASEEHLLKSYDDDILMLWRSTDSVVVGKHQVAATEANQEYSCINQIPVIRRISGGGTVFHDLGNINFTVITKSINPNINFPEHTKPIIEFLEKLGLNAGFEGKNDVRVNGLKVSGNAAHLFKNKTLYHGTLLFNSNIEKLNNSINPSGATLETKAIQSIRSKVVNISSFVNNDTSIDDFYNGFKKFLLKYYNVKTERLFSEDEKIQVQKLVDEKYCKDEWNYHYSPNYVFANHFFYNENRIKFSLKIEKGVIVNADYETGQSMPEVELFFSTLIGNYHSPSSILPILQRHGIEKPGNLSNPQMWSTLKMFF
jgi:lipoate---protein ligase